jgi:gliding motility-associated-like protein
VYTVFGRLTGSTNNIIFGTRYTGEDLTGTRIRSIPDPVSGSACKKIAVFSGSGKLSLTCNSNVGSSDNYMQQAFPPNAWGKKYLTVPTAVLPGNIYRVAVKDPNTIVRRNGTPIFRGSLRNGFYYEFSSSSPEVIDSDQPILVAQFISSATMNRDIRNNNPVQQSSCNNDVSTGSVGDPEMIYLSPIEQTINKVTINSTSNFGINRHYLNLVIHKDGIIPGKKFLLDGNPIIQTPTVHPFDPNYVYFQLSLNAGSHTIDADSGFNAIVYGYGTYESYGYNAGTNVNDLNQFISVQNEFATVPFPSTCKGAPFKFSITLPYQPIKLNWKFNNTTGFLKKSDGSNAIDTSITNVGNPIAPDDMIPSPTDPTRMLFVYRLPAPYSFALNGDFPVKIVVEYASGSNNGCTGEQEIDYDVRVFEPPSTKLIALSTGCVNENLQLTAINTLEQDVDPLKYLWEINGVSSETITAAKDSILKTEGLKNIRLRLITNIGCVSQYVDTTIYVSAKPKIDFLPDDVRCIGKAFVLTDKSIPGSNSTFSKLTSWQWEADDIKENQTNLSTNFTKTYDVKDATIKLLVSSSTGCLDSLSKPIKIYPNPLIDFELPESCVKDISSFVGNLVTIEDNRNLSKFEWNFGNPGSSNQYPNIISINSADTVRHFYTAPGQYTVKLGVTSQDGCYELKDTVFEVNGSDPVADFNVLNAAGLCSNTPIQILNKSAMASTQSFGKITRVRVFWDWNTALNPPLPDTDADFTDEVPFIDDKYSFSYTDFNNQNSKNFTIRMVAYSGEKCFTEKQIQVPVKGSPVVTFNAIPGICLDTEKRSVSNLVSQVDVSGINTGNGVFSGPGVSSNGTFSPYLVGAGDYPILYTFTSSNSCFDTLTQFIKVWPSPVADYSTSSLICEKNEITFTSTANPRVGTLADYEWIYSDDASISFAQNINKKTFTSYGNYDVKHIVVTSNGCRDTLTRAIEINPIPDVNFTLNQSICLPDGLAEFSNLTTTPDNKSMSYLWDYGDPGGNNQATTIKGSHNYLQFKSYSIKLISTIPATGCKDSIIKTIEPLVDIFPQPEASITSVDFVCIGTPINFKEVSDSKAGNVSAMKSWKWDFVVTSSGSKDPEYLFTQPGTYTVKMVATSDKGCKSNTATKTITIHPFPEITAGPDINVLDDGQKQIMASAKGKDLVYSWSPATYLSATNVLQPVVEKPLEDIIYTLKVTGIGGCERSDKVRIIALKIINAPNTFTPNGDGVNDLWVIKNLNFYQDCVVEVYTPQGLMVYRSVNYARPWDGTYNGKPLPTGTYYYVINTNSERKLKSGYVTILK